MKRHAISVFFAATLILATSAALDAQVRFGGQANFADDTDFGLGPRVAVNLEQLGPRFQVLGTWDIYFPDDDNLDFWELNGNLVYRFDVQEVPSIVPYAGGGLNIARREIELDPPAGDVDDTDVGVNFLGGVEFPLASVTPFVEIRLTEEGGDQFYLTGGVMVP